MNIVITGANRGLGIELAAEAASRGHTVWAGVRNVNTADTLFDMSKKYPGKIQVVPLDVTDENDIAAFADRLERQGQIVDSIVNNAAVLVGREQGLEELQIADLELTMNVNLYGPVRMVKHFLSLLPPNGGGTIVNISSASGSFEHAFGGDYAYGMSKASLNFFSQQLHRLLEPKGIQVYAVHPGWLKTDMGGPLAPSDPSEPAAGIIDLAEGKIKCESEYVFVNSNGQPLKR